MFIVNAVPGEGDMVAVVDTGYNRRRFWLQGIAYAVLTAVVTISLALALSGPSQERDRQVQQNVDSLLCVLAVQSNERTVKTYRDCGIDIPALEERTGADLFPGEREGDSRRQPER